MRQVFVIRPLESAAQCRTKSHAERQEHQADELNIQRGQFGYEIKANPGDRQKSGSDSQYGSRRFGGHPSSHNHEEDEAEFQYANQSHGG
jgi:hypothetical protein